MPGDRKAIRKACNGETIRQVAAIPFRRAMQGGIEIMLVTSRTTNRFVIPKGWPMKGMSDRKAASIEACEEAGVIGTAMKQPVGCYHYWKRLSTRFVPVEVTVFLLDVEGLQDDWKEADRRRRAWLRPGDAADLVDEPELATLLGSLEGQQAAGAALPTA